MVEQAIYCIVILALEDVFECAELRGEAVGDGRQGYQAGLLTAQAEGDGGEGADRAVDAQPAAVALNETEAGGVGGFGAGANGQKVLMGRRGLIAQQGCPAEIYAVEASGAEVGGTVRTAEESVGEMDVVDIQVHECSATGCGVKGGQHFAAQVGVVAGGALAVVALNMTYRAQLWQELVAQDAEGGEVQQGHGLEEHQAAGAGFIHQLLELAGREAGGLLEDDVLACQEGAQGEVVVGAVDDCDVHGLYLRV